MSQAERARAGLHLRQKMFGDTDPNGKAPAPNAATAQWHALRAQGLIPEQHMSADQIAKVER
jgi:hypothetical protein